MKGTTARCSDQTVLQKEMINTILGDRTANQVGHGFQPLRGVFHSNAGTHRFQQFNVVVAITECHGVFLAELKMGKYLTDAGAFAAAFGDNVCCPVPPGGDFGPGYPLQNGIVVRFPAAQHDLVNFFPACFLEILCYSQLQMGN